MTHDAGLGKFILDNELEWCADTGEQCWRWTGTATDGVQWVFIRIEDCALDPTGNARKEAEDFDRPLASNATPYSVTARLVSNTQHRNREVRGIDGAGMFEVLEELEQSIYRLGVVSKKIAKDGRK